MKFNRIIIIFIALQIVNLGLWGWMYWDMKKLDNINNNQGVLIADIVKIPGLKDALIQINPRWSEVFK